MLAGTGPLGPPNPPPERVRIVDNLIPEGGTISATSPTADLAPRLIGLNAEALKWPLS